MSVRNQGATSLPAPSAEGCSGGAGWCGCGSSRCRATG